MVDAAVDTDPIKPGREACSIPKVEFGKRADSLDEGLLEDVFGILWVLRILIGHSEDFVFVLIKQDFQGFSVSFFSQSD